MVIVAEFLKHHVVLYKNECARMEMNERSNPLTDKDRKGVVLVRLEDGKEVIYTKYIYLKMKKAGRNVVLLKEAKTIENLLRGKTRF